MKYNSSDSHPDLREALAAFMKTSNSELREDGEGISDILGAADNKAIVLNKAFIDALSDLLCAFQNEPEESPLNDELNALSNSVLCHPIYRVEIARKAGIDAEYYAFNLGEFDKEYL